MCSWLRRVDKTLPLVFCGIYGFYHCVVTGLVVTTVNNSHPVFVLFYSFFLSLIFNGT